jgi:nicotinate-nucleotide adenylyltransferase
LIVVVRAKRIGVLGGTFDPIHHNHLLQASEVAHCFGLDQVVFVPAGRPCHKDPETVSPAEDRFAMTVLAAAPDPRFSVSRIEIDRPGATYTVDTLRAMWLHYGSGIELYFILGADCLAQLLTWRQAATLFVLAHFVGCSRLGCELTRSGLPDGRVSLVEVPMLAISSTLIRDRVNHGKPIRRLVPERVAAYIDQRGLYRSAWAGDARSVEADRR